jgi:curved DNA-binding protein CbpA
MKTLYELLGALPDDDAESLKAAYRRAAKANHPDNNPGDPDAPQRFRQIVRANAILSDERQRAIYDRMLEIALQQQGLESERGVSSSTIRKIAPDAIAIAILSVAFIGGFLLLGDMFKAPLFSAPMSEVSRREPAQTAAATPTEPSDTAGQPVPRDKPRDVAAPNTPAGPEAFKEAATPDAAAKETATPDVAAKEAPTPDAAAKEAPTPDAAPAEKTGSAPAIDNVPVPRDFGVNDARYYRERGVLAYRNGDLYLALVNFNLAIELDPGFADAYVDRGIVLYRLGDLERAFADIARANRVDASRPNKIPPTAGAP